MIIWRMEGPDGKGPFRGKYFAYEAGSCQHIPVPIVSHGYMAESYEIFGTEGKYLCEWFLPSLKLLNRSRQKLVKLSIAKKDLKFFEKQVLFQRKQAKVIREYSPSHILKFKKQKSRKADA